jgi:hypothetical protein
MLHDRRQRHRKRRGDLAHRQAVLFGQPLQDRAPCRIGQSREGRIEAVISIVNQ